MAGNFLTWLGAAFAAWFAVVPPRLGCFPQEAFLPCLYFPCHLIRPSSTVIFFNNLPHLLISLPFLCHSVAKVCPALCDPMDCSTPGFPIFHYFSEFAQTLVHWVDGAIQPSHPLLPSFLLPSVFTCTRVFSNEWAFCIRWPKYWSFSTSPFNEYSGLIFFRIDWFDLLAVQATLKSLLQHHSSKASILQCSVFFMVQLTFIHGYWKNHSFDYTNQLKSLQWI